jgi:hypothetical protein
MNKRRQHHPSTYRMPVAPVAPTATDITNAEEWVITDEDLEFAIHIWKLREQQGR